MAITLAREGVDVLLVECERIFRDRVRGEGDGCVGHGRGEAAWSI